MRYSFLGSLASLLLAACGRTDVAAPRLDLVPSAAEEYRLDLDHGVVVACDNGASSEAQGKVA